MDKKSLLTLVLGSYQSCCSMMAEFKAIEKKEDALAFITSDLITSSYSMQLSMFRNILMDAELTTDEVTVVEQILKKVETKYTNEEVLDSVKKIREALLV